MVRNSTRIFPVCPSDTSGSRPLVFALNAWGANWTSEELLNPTSWLSHPALRRFCARAGDLRSLRFIGIITHELRDENLGSYVPMSITLSPPTVCLPLQAPAVWASHLVDLISLTVDLVPAVKAGSIEIVPNRVHFIPAGARCLHGSPEAKWICGWGHSWI